MATEDKETMEEIKNAISNNNLELLETLLSNKTPEFCGQVLYFAVKKGNEDLDQIRRNKSDNDFEEVTKAINDKTKQLVKLFLGHGADMNVTVSENFLDYEYYTLFGYVCFSSNIDIIQS